MAIFEQFEAFDRETHEGRHREMLSLIGPLHEDIDRAKALLESDPSDTFARRLLVRSVFTMVEGIVFAMKSMALAELKGKLTAAEVSILSEKAYELGDKGEIRERDSFVNVKHNLKFAFLMYARVLDVEFEVSAGGDGWRAFVESIPVRNRLTHPKNFTDLEVNDSEVEKAKTVADWFMMQVVKVMILNLSVLEAEIVSDTGDPEALFSERLKGQMNEVGGFIDKKLTELS